MERVEALYTSIADQIHQRASLNLSAACCSL
jgi:hypothetical protein